MPKIIINKKEFEIKQDKNLLEASLSLGFDLPYFCWHPKLGSVGACRQCAVKKYKDENDTKGRIVMACMEAATDGSIISIDDPEVKEFRGNVVEALMTNHPHDCPVCDEGGECHLQDMTVMTGHNYRKYKFTKRTYRNQNLGPFINHEMNRCIQCYRCVRFYRDYADGEDLNAFAHKNHVYFGRAEDGTLENEFSGNLVEVCPTGVFTDKTLKNHYSRKWDLTMAPSVCTHCSVGCNTIAGERYGSLRRVYSRYNGEVNGYFLCDRGRFGYEFVNDKKRIRSFYVGDKSGTLTAIDRDKAFNKAAEVVKSRKLVGIGSPRASLEANYLLRELVGENNYSNGLSEAQQKLNSLALDILKKGDVRTPSLKEIEHADVVFMLGEDVTNTAPMIALALRQAAKNIPRNNASKKGVALWNDAAIREIVQNSHGPFYIAAPSKTRLDKVASATYFNAPDNIARLGYAVAHHIDQGAPMPQGLSESEKSLAEKIAKDLKSADNPLIVSGVHAQNEAVIMAAANIAWALKKSGKNPGLTLTLEEYNSAGVGMLGGISIEKAMEAVTSGKADAAIILENDLYRRIGKNSVDEFIGKCSEVIVLDHSENATSLKGSLIMPVGTFAESDGTVVNNEGRAQRFYRVFAPEGDVRQSWKRIAEILEAGGRGSSYKTLQNVTDAVNGSVEIFKGITGITPPPDFRVNGQKIPRESHRYSGRTAMNANKHVSEPKPPEDDDSPMSFTMEGFQGAPPSSMIPFFWNPGWNSAQAINKYQIEVGGPLHGGDPGFRLIEPSAQGHTYFDSIPGAWKGNSSDMKFTGIYHIFGSEQFSSMAPGVAQRVPAPYLALNASDAAKLNLSEGAETTLSVNETDIKVKIVIKDELVEGLAGIPAGLSGMTPGTGIKLSAK